MWYNKQHGIMPNQYHYFYEQGDTMIYPEHIHDLITIDTMWNSRLKRDQNKSEAKAKNELNNPLKQKQQQQMGGFYNKTYKYNNK